MVGDPHPGELTRVDTAQQPLDRRRYRRAPLDAFGALVLGSTTFEGPCDLSRSGAGLIVPVAPPIGTEVRAWLPPQGDSPDGLELAGRVARVSLMVTPVVRDGSTLRTLHCFRCGWTGYLDPGSGELRTTLERASEGAFGERTRVGTPLESGVPQECPTCAVGDLSAIDRPYHAVGIDLSGLGWREEEQFLRYLERAVLRSAERDPDQHQRHLREYVPAQIRCPIDEPRALARLFVESLQHGRMSFQTATEHPLGDEVRIVLLCGPEADGMVLPARIASRTLQDRQHRYEVQLLRMDEASLADLRSFVDEVSGEGARRLAETASIVLPPLARGPSKLLVGTALGLALGLAIILLIALR